MCAMSLQSPHPGPSVLIDQPCATISLLYLLPSDLGAIKNQETIFAIQTNETESLHINKSKPHTDLPSRIAADGVNRL